MPRLTGAQGPATPRCLRSGRPLLLLTVLALLLAAAMLGALAVGTEPFPLGTTVSALFGAAEPWQRAVVLDVRLPRVLIAALGGAGLALSGAALQGLLQNPLADPSVLGVSSGATLGAVLALYLVPVASLLIVPAASFVVALGAALLTVRLARASGASGTSLLLAGVAVASAGSALTSFVLSLSLAEWEFGMQVLSWMMGGLEGRSWPHLFAMAPPVLLGGLACLRFGRDLDALALGEETAASLGRDVGAARRSLLVLTSLVTAAVASTIGSVAFVGLVVPHALRLGARLSHRALLSASALGGALLLVLADTLCRAAASSIDLRPGTISSAIGAPFFLWLLVRRKAA